MHLQLLQPTSAEPLVVVNKKVGIDSPGSSCVLPSIPLVRLMHLRLLQEGIMTDKMVLLISMSGKQYGGYCYLYIENSEVLFQTNTGRV